MEYLLALIVLLAVGGAAVFAVVQLLQARRREQELEQLEAKTAKERAEFEQQLGRAKSEVERLSKWKHVADADEQAAKMIAEARAELEQAERMAKTLLEDAERQAAEVMEKARQDAEQERTDARKSAKEQRDEAKAILDSATQKAEEIVTAATQRAEEIAGKAYDAVKNAELYEKTVKSMRNIIDGYGDSYLIPARSLLDDLADDFSHTDAGRELKRARQHAQVMAKNGTAAECDYAEAFRKEMAERFVLDAFNGKVDSILSRVKHDNAGKLEQEIRDAFNLVNYNGKPFRNARVKQAYLDARLEELKWAAITQELKRQEKEEQRRIKEQIREEQRAQREFEKAQREAAKQEKMLRDAMAKAQAAVAEASEEQRAEYEQQLADLEAKLVEAEEKNQRAISMAQQTKRGHVYIISNVGSFGEGVYKIGLTRRLDPADRIKELGDASVPFEFDVHAMIFSEDAPALEHELHRHFVLGQVNKVNHRKEFFRAELAEIRQRIEERGYQAHWTMLSSAAEFRETQAIEQAIADDPEAREAWLNRQLTLEVAEDEELTTAATGD